MPVVTHATGDVDEARGDAAQPQGLTHHPVVGARLQKALISGLLGAIRRVVEAMRAQPGRPFTAAELAAIAGVSIRSLR